jgi:hypothetical protein
VILLFGDGQMTTAGAFIRRKYGGLLTGRPVRYISDD